MLFMTSSFITLMTLMSILTMIIQRNHFLMSLLALEGVTLTITFSILSNASQEELFLAFVLLTFAACEASLGLACLVSMTRSYGNDMYSSLSMNKC